MAEDQAPESGAEATEAESTESGGEDQTVTREQFEKELAALKKQYESEAKKEIAGLNRKVSELTQAKKDAEDAGKSELQKLQERMDEIDREKAELRMVALREKAARTAGLDPKYDHLITGTDEQSIGKSVELLVQFKQEAVTEATKKHDRENGRTVSGPARDAPTSYDRLQEMSEDQLKSMNPRDIARIIEEAAGK